MSLEELWPPLLAAFLSNATLIAIWKGIVEKYVDLRIRRGERDEDEKRKREFLDYQKKIDAQFEKELNEIKAQLAKEQAALQHSFSMHLSAFNARNNPWAVKQLEVFATFYVKLFDTQVAISDLGACNTLEQHNEKYPAYKAADNEATTYYFAHRLFFGPAESAAVNAVLSYFEEVVTNFRLRYSLPQSGQILVDHFRDVQMANKSLRESVNKCREVFHAILSTGEVEPSKPGEPKEQSKGA